MARILENFQSEPYAFAVGGDWERVDTDSYDGDYSLASTNQGVHSSESVATITFTALENEAISLWYRVSSQAYRDEVMFYVDDVFVTERSGDHPWRIFYYEVSPGEHVLTVKYVKNASINHNEDTAFIDYVALGEVAAVVEISTAEGLANINPHMAGKYLLTGDIDLAGVEWVPIGYPGTPSSFYSYEFFEGVLDGGGHKVYNLSTSTDADFAGLFSVAWHSAKIENLGLVDINFSFAVGRTAGALVGEKYGGTIKNCYSTGSILTFEGVYIGGLVGVDYGGGIIESCYSTVDITGGRTFVGGLVGSCDSPEPGSVIDCHATGNIVGSDTDDNNYFGGLIGMNIISSVTNCYATGTIIGASPTDQNSYFGGLIGMEIESEIYNCYATGNIVGDRHKDFVGGLIGMDSESHIERCYATGSVTGYSAVGGLSGGSYDSSISTSYAKGNVVYGWDDGWGGYSIGGLVGDVRSTILNCYARGNVTPLMVSAYNEWAGGLVGEVRNGGTIENCYAAGLVEGEADLGGLIGVNNGVVTNSYYDYQTSEQSDTGKGEPRTTAQMVYSYTEKHAEGTFVSWGFENKHIMNLTDYDFVFGEPWKHDPTFTLNDGYPLFEPTPYPTLTKIADCYTPTNPLFSVSLDYGPFNNTVIERQDTMIAQYRFTNPPTGLTLKTKWRYLTPKLEHNVICGFECRGILIRYKLKGRKPKLIPEFE